MATSVPATTAAGTAEIKLDRLFVPIDFSPLSERAVDYARRIAGRHNAEILLAHVSQPVSNMAVPEAAWYHLQAAEHKESQQLAQIGARLRSEGLQARTISLSGLLQDEIPCCSKQECSDLIVLGTYINSGIERLLFGCDSEVLFRHAGCPVLAIGPNTRPAPDHPWNLKDVVCASDLRPQSAPAAAFAWRIAQKYEAAFTLLHVECRSTKISTEDRSRFEQSLASILPEAENLTSTLRSLPSGHTPSSTIVDQARQRHSDLIVMGAHPCSAAATRLPRGITAQVISEAPCPVLVLHTP